MRLRDSRFLTADIDDALPFGAKALVPLEFGLGFTPGPALSLIVVGVREQGKLWRMVLASPTIETDGEIRCELGSYPVGTALQVRFEATPISADVPRLAAGVIQGHVIRKLKEKKDLKRMEDWSEKFDYTVE